MNTIEDFIVATVCERFGVSAEQLASPSTDRVYLIPRQVVNYFLKRYSELPDRLLSERTGKERSSIIWDSKAVSDRMDVYPEFNSMIIHLNQLINARKSNKEAVQQRTRKVGMVSNSFDPNITERNS